MNAGTSTRFVFTGKRLPCPSCGSSRGFAPDARDNTQGYCHACQTTITGTTNVGRTTQAPPTAAPTDEHPQRPAPTVTYDQTDTLSRFLVSLPRAGEPMRLHLKQWSIGATTDGRTVCDHGNVCFKAMAYGSDGKRDKNRQPFWHPTGAAVPLFGCQWLADGVSFVDYQSWATHTLTTRTPVMLVESEKTAVLASFLFPAVCWLACGGASGLTRHKAQTLRGRTVTVLFDCDQAGTDGAERARQALTDVGAKAIVKTLNDVIPNAPDGYDIGDWVLSELTQPLEYSEDYERQAIQWVARWN